MAALDTCLLLVVGKVPSLSSLALASLWTKRRIAHGRGGSLASHRTRRHNNPPPTSSSSSGPLSTLSPATRETVDPIAELLSQLSGVRRAAGSSSSQLHQLQMELQLQRQQAQAQRQTLDRLA